MARTIAEIEAEITAAKEAKPELDVLNSPSNAAGWNLWRYIVAAAHHTLEVLVEEQAANAISGTTKWYAKKVLEFQYGDIVSLVDYVPLYLVPDETKRIVDRVSVVDISGAVVIKVAKDNAGSLEPLTSDEVTALTSYVNEIKFAGVNTILISQAADLLHISADIYYNGQLDLTAFKATVEAAIDTFIKEIPFDGLLYKNKLIDAIQAIEGVNDVQLKVLNAKSSGGVYSGIDRVDNPTSGYYAIDPAYPLSNVAQLNYIAE